MTSANAANGKLSVVPKANSYFYETFTCQAASSKGYDAIDFSVKGPAGASLTLEIQTKSACSADAYQSYFYTISGLTGTIQTINVPLSSFFGANANAVTSFVWSGFSSLSTAWEFGKIQFGCSAGSSSRSDSASRPTSSNIVSRASTLSTISTSAAVPTDQCTNLLIDDLTPHSRLTFLYYNAMLNPSSDDGTMASVVVDSTQNRVTYSPKDGSSYFHTQLGCTNAENRFGGISMRLKAPIGTRLSVEIDSGCHGESDKQTTLPSTDLRWTFDGTERLYSIPFNKFDGLDVERSQRCYSPS
jgi:hypothetical protein